MIHPPAKALLETFSKVPLFKEHKAVLIGGTAIAYHTQHRVSFDLDISFPHHDTLPSLDFLENHNATPLPFDRAIVDTMTNEGGVMEDYHQRFSIDGVKVDFVVNPSSNIYEKEILKNDASLNHGTLNITSLDALFKLKSLLILDRNKIRDLYDLVYLLRHNSFTAKYLLDTIKEYRITYTDKQIIQLVESKEADELDVEFEGISEPKMDITSYNDLKKILVDSLTTEI